MVGAIVICLVIALAVWGAVHQLQEMTDNAVWEPYEEIPEDQFPSTTFLDDPFASGDPYVAVPPGEEDPPEDAALSEEQIRAALRTAFDQFATPEQWLAVVDAPVEVGERLKTLAAGCGTAEVSVGRIAFESPQEAVVEFRFRNVTIPGGDAMVFHGGAQRLGGTWMVTRRTIDDVIAIAEPFCG